MPHELHHRLAAAPRVRVPDGDGPLEPTARKHLEEVGPLELVDALAHAVLVDLAQLANVRLGSALEVADLDGAIEARAAPRLPFERLQAEIERKFGYVLHGDH